MDVFEVNLRSEIHSGIPIIEVKGYLAKEAGLIIIRLVEEAARRGNIRMVIDLTDCRILSSPGVALLLEVTMRVVDDFRGRLVYSGLDKSKNQLLSMTGVLPAALYAKTPEEASLLASQG